MADEPMGRVLVIDDSPTNVATIRLELEQVGYEVLTAATGRAGLETAVTRLPDVVLLDILMPDIDGYEVCRQIRTTPATSGIPVVVITGLQGSADRLLALDLGANDFLSKPVDGVELLARVRSLVRLKHLNDQLQRQAALAEAAAGRERIAAILESITDAFVAVDEQWRFTYINQRAEHMLGEPREELLGADFWEHFATTPDSPAAERSHQAMVEHVPVAFESLYPPLDAWFEVHVYPRDDGVSFYFHDITARKRAEEEIHELNALLEQRVRERTAELESANRQLDQASRMKSEFLASMSHELRTPLNAIIGFSELLLDAKFDDMAHEERTEFLGHINRGGHHLLDLINDILDLSKVEAGRMELHLETVSLNQLIQGCRAIIQPLALKKKIAVEATCQPSTGTVRVDPARVKQVLYNLLSNAVKFTPESGHVTVTAQLDQEGARVAVRDDGVGIKPEDQEAVFEEFRQVGDTTRQPEGTGLGLALVRRLVELHGGSIWLESAPGQGSCFTFSLPAKPVAEDDTGTARSERRAPAAAGSGRRPPKGLPILVVEDEREAAELLMLHLSRAGYDVYRASTMEETLAMVRQLQPFAVTLDILMPDRDGWEILSALKANPATRDVPIVVISVVDNPELGFALGATDYLVKPIDKDALLSTLRRLDRQTRPDGGRPRVLVVDDDPAARALQSVLIESANCDVVLAEDGAEAVRIALSQPLDLVLLDLMMPGMNGFDVVRELRRSPETSGLPIVICTAKELSPEEREELRGQVESIIDKDSGANDILLELLQLERFYPKLAGIVGGPTGQAVAGHFIPHLERELSRAARHQRSFSVLSAQVQVQPSHSPPSPDYSEAGILAELSQSLSKELRRYDVVAQDHGDILVLLPEIGPEQVPAVVAKLQIMVESLQQPPGGLLSEVRVVFGHASYPAQARTPAELLQQARRAHATPSEEDSGLESGEGHGDG